MFFDPTKSHRRREHMGLKTLEDLEAELQNDIKVKVAGVDADGVMRGKVMAKDKFLSAAKSGFGFCRSVWERWPS